ncbi:MAG: thioredoxin family protein [Candidatus Omnitrophica bacterium]|nr:thioredoxin family protein [Candidatus Omnitrophota bacterium]MDD5574164.1 thioredoxin family protein [Candidatus Omnitrophota bacterium]
MALKKIEIVCRPCPKCDGLENKIRDIVKAIGIANKAAIVFTFVHTKDLAGLADLGVNPGMTPVLLINGQVELAGRIDIGALKKRLEAIHKIG